MSSLKVAFDNRISEWAEDFDINIYAGSTLEHTEVVTGNSSWKYEATITEVEDVTQVEIVVKSWSYPEEKANDTKFANDLSKLADVYVNDAFGTSHRAHASVHKVTKYLPSAVGLLLQKEIDIMGKALAKPKRPFIAIIGGVKVSGKIDVINSLLKKVDALLIGGAMMFTFYKAMNTETGKSVVEKDKVELARKLIKKSKGKFKNCFF